MEEGRYIDGFHRTEPKVTAVTNFQSRKLLCCVDQFFRTTGRDFLIPAIPVILRLAGSEFKEDIVLRHELWIAAKLTTYGIVGFTLAHHGLLHVRFHFREALTEPTLAVLEAADLTVIQNAVEAICFCQVVHHRWCRYFYIGHSIFLLHLQFRHQSATEQSACRHIRQFL